MNEQLTIEEQLIRERRIRRSYDDTFTVLANLKEQLPEVWEKAEVVGFWIWVEFDSMPPQEIRTRLLDLGFHWNRMRKVWQHCGGKPSAHTTGNPKLIYSTMPANAFETDVEGNQA